MGLILAKSLMYISKPSLVMDKQLKRQSRVFLSVLFKGREMENKLIWSADFCQLLQAASLGGLVSNPLPTWKDKSEQSTYPVCNIITYFQIYVNKMFG